MPKRERTELPEQDAWVVGENYKRSSEALQTQQCCSVGSSRPHQRLGPDVLAPPRESSVDKRWVKQGSLLLFTFSS
jgi:hypothetical protein